MPKHVLYAKIAPSHGRIWTSSNKLAGVHYFSPLNLQRYGADMAYHYIIPLCLHNYTITLYLVT